MKNGTNTSIYPSKFLGTKNSRNKLEKEYLILKSVINNISDGVVIADNHGKFLFFNPVAEQILGIGSQDIDQGEWSSVYGVFYPDEETPFPTEELPLSRVISGSEACSSELFIRNHERPDGVNIYVSASPLRDKNGTLIGGAVIVQDITQSKISEKLRIQSEQRLIAQFKSYPVPSYIWEKVGDDFVLIDYNLAAEIFTGNQVEQLVGKKISEIYWDSPEILSDFNLCYDNKTLFAQEMTYTFRTTGISKDLIVNYVFVEPNLVMVHTEDITERKESEVEIKKLSNAVQQTADSVVITNRKGLIEYVNPAFEQTTGFKRNEIIGKRPSIIKSGLHDDSFYKNMWAKIINGNTFRDTIINKKKNGELYWCEQTITPMKDNEGTITNFVSVLKDVTELLEKKEHEFQLKLASELQQRFYRAVMADLPGFDLAGISIPAVDIGGDYFDFIKLSDGSLLIAIGDVSGHGIAPALIMTETRAYLRSFSKSVSDPAILLKMLNKELFADLGDESFVTLNLTRLDLSNNQIEYASAGHETACIMDGNGNEKYQMKSSGVPLGVLADFNYENSVQINLSPEDIIVYLTDGVIEASNSSFDRFGRDKMFDIIRNNKKNSSKDIIEKVHNEVRSFSKNIPQEDDFTLLICKVDP